MFALRRTFRYLLLAVGAAVLIVGLNNCSSQPPQQVISPTPPTATQTEPARGKPKININTAILSQLDKLEAQLGVPALSHKIQASRPYGSIEDLVTKQVLTQEQFNKIKDQVTVEDIVLTGKAKDVDYMTKLGLMKGHMIVAGELLELKEPDQAEPHLGHPVEEIYVDIQDQLGERGVPEFSEVLTSVQDLVKSKPEDPQVQPKYEEGIAAIDKAINALPESERQSPAFALQVINGLLDTAVSEYTASISQGKISAAIEYQDSRGFVEYAQSLYQNIEPQLAKTHPEVNQKLKAAFAELAKAWPAAIPPATPVLSVDEVVAQVKAIETLTQPIIKAS